MTGTIVKSASPSGSSPVMKSAPKMGINVADPLAKAAHAIENIGNEPSALALVHSLLKEGALNYVQLGGVLQRIKEEGWFSGYASFGELCEGEFGFRKSKAYHLIAIYNLLLDLNVSWEAVASLGWSKLQLLCAACLSQKIGMDEFSKRLESASVLTFTQLKASLTNCAVGKNSDPSHSLSFKPHSDQLEIIEAAIAKSKSISGTEFDAVALEHICLDFLGGTAASQTDIHATPVAHTLGFISDGITVTRAKVSVPTIQKGGTLQFTALDELGASTVVIVVGEECSKEAVLAAVETIAKAIDEHGLHDAG